MRKNQYRLPDRVCKIIEGLSPLRPRPTRDIIHVTELMMPAYARNLLVDKWDEIETDYSDWLTSCQGDALHSAYARLVGASGEWETEWSFKEEIESVNLVGTLDAYHYDTKTLIDLKQTAVWVPGYKIPDYIKQTNCYAWFLWKRGLGVNKIYIDVWYRDWKLKQSTYSHDYPKIPFELLGLEIWPIVKTEQFIGDQIHYLLMCKDECSREDKWQKFNVMKNKNKTPSRNCTTREECEAWISSYQKKNPKKRDKFTVIDSPPLNCISYCSARSVCPYAKSLMKGK